MISVLLLVPNEITREGLIAFLASQDDIEIAGVAKTAEEARIRLADLHPNVCVIDDSMNDDLIEYASNLNVNTVVLSRTADDTAVRHALSRGAEAFVSKESSIALVLTAIRAAHVGATWLDPAVARHFLSSLSASATVKRNNDRSAGRSILSDRELEVLSLVAEGYSNEAIASRLSLSKETIKTHVRHIMEKLEASTRTEAAIHALRLGLLGEVASPALSASA